MGFLMDGLEPESYDRSYSDKALIGRIANYFRPHWRVMLGVGLLIVLNSLMDIVLPVLVAQGVDTLGTARTLDTVAMLVGAILLSGVLSWVFNFLRQTYTARMVGDVVLKLRLDAFAAVISRDMSFFDEESSGRIISRVTSDTNAFSTVVTLVLNLMSQALLVVLMAGVLLSIDWQLALYAMVIAPLIILIVIAFRRIAREGITRSMRVGATVNSTVQEAISGITVAKNFRQEAKMYREFRDVNKQAYGINVRTGLIFSGVFPLLATAAGIGTVIIVYFGGLSAASGAISPGKWLLFVESIGIFWFPLTSIASFWSQFQQGLAAGERIFALIDDTPRVKQIDDQPVPLVRGRIEFRDLTFSYNDKEQVLDKFNLIIPAGQYVAVVGHTGAGKSTLGKLVSRFYEYQSGDLLIDDRDIRTLRLGMYRRHLGVVPQVPFLFSGTVADNIRYSRPEASDEDVAAAARTIANGDWLKLLPNGLTTEVGEMGKGLSMGQRQLVALARVLLQDPSIIILDEATASVDPLTEAEIQEGLDVVLEGRTAIVIAHRLSTVRQADRILVMRQGVVVEEGTHDSLLAAGGHYAQLYNTYFRHQSADYRPGEGFVAVRDSLPLMEVVDEAGVAA